MKPLPNCIQAKASAPQSEPRRQQREFSCRVIKVVPMLCDISISNSKPPILITSLRIIKCLVWWKEISVVPYTALKLSWVTVLRCYPESSARVMTWWFQQVQGSTVMSWFRLSGTAWVQSVTEELKVSTHIDFRKYLIFRGDILFFAKNTLTVKFTPNTLYISMSCVKCFIMDAWLLNCLV